MKFLPALFFCFAVTAPLNYAEETAVGIASTSASIDSTTISNPSTESSSVVTTELTSSAASETTVATSPESTSATTEQAESTTTVVTTSTSKVTVETLNATSAEFVNKLSNQIRDVLKHFQDPNPTGFPGQTVLEDPLKVPNKTISLGFFTGDFYNTTVHGLSNFTIDSVNTHLDQLEVYMMIKMKKVHILGNCTIGTIIGLSTRGPFNITLWNVTAEGTVYLTVNPDGSLHANKSVSEMTHESLSVSTVSGGTLESALSTAGSTILLALKPYILEQIDERISREVNSHLQNVPKIPAIVERTPVDLAIIEARKFVRANYEPFVINKIVEHDSEFLAVSVGPISIHGLSKFGRVGSVTLKMVNRTVIITLRMITGRLTGKCNFFYDFGKIGSPREGVATFSVAHLQFEAKVNQSVDFRKKPILDDLQLETGRVLVQLDGKGRLDYLLELTLELLPQMLRYIIIDAMEEPIKQKIQKEILDKLNVEELVEQYLPLLEELYMQSIKDVLTPK